MYISNLEFLQLKGRSGSYRFSPTTLIVGPNFSGKTAIMDAVRLTLLAYHPALKKRNQDIFDLASGPVMRAKLTMDTGVDLTREFSESATGVKQTTNIDPLNFATPLLDASAYFQMTDGEKIDYIFSKVELGEEFTPVGVISALQRETWEKDHSEAIEEAKKLAITLCQDVFEETDKVADALAILTTSTLKDEFSLWNKRVKDTEGTARVLTELKLQEDECTAETLTDLDNEISRLQGLLGEANTEAGRLSEQRRQSLAVTERRSEIQRQLAQPAPQEPPAALPPWADPRPALEEQIRNIDAEIAALPPLPERIEVAEAYQKAERDYVMLDQRAAGAERQIEALQQEISEIQSQKCCPTCKSAAKGWQKRVVESLNESIAKLRPEVNPPALTVAGIAYESAKAAHIKFNSDSGIAAELHQRKQTCRDAIASATQTATARDNRLRSSREQFQRDQASYQTRQTSLTEELARLKDVDPPHQSELDAATQALWTLKQQHSDAVQKRDTGKKLQQDLVRAAQAAEEHTLAKAKLNVTKRFGEKLKEMKGKMVTSAFAKLLETSNAICGDILPSPLAYHEGTLGRWGTAKEGGRFIKHTTFSGTEEALAYVALAAGLSADAPFKLLLIDELGRITAELQGVVLEKLALAVKNGLLDQVIAAMPLDVADAENFEAPSEWIVINTSAK